MKKLYRRGTVHPSPPSISDHHLLLSLLPATILSLTVALSPQEKEVLVYLLSSSSNNFSGNPRRSKGIVDGDHPPLFHCNCFRCYMSYWVRWDSSPNHKLIHQIIDAYEEYSFSQTSKPSKNNRKEKKNKKASNNKPAELNRSELLIPPPESVVETSNGGCGSDREVDGDGDEVEDEEKGSVRRFVSFIGERIWGAWA